MMKIEAHWSGSYPNLCHGKWILTIDDIDMSDRIPEKLRTAPMNTAISYEVWYFENGYEVAWDWQSDGLTCDEWIAANPWVKDIPAPDEEIYAAFQEKDWRYGTCGGCI